MHSDRSDTDFNLLYSIKLIDLLDQTTPELFWGGKGSQFPKRAEQASGINILKTRLADFRHHYPDLINNDAALLSFFNTCREAINEQVKKLDKKLPNACLLYDALINYDKNAINILHDARIKQNEFVIIKSRLSDYDNNPTLEKYEKTFKAFQKAGQKNGSRPYLLLMFDYLASQSKNPQRDIKWILTTLEKLSDDLLMHDNSAFLNAFPTPETLALCLRSDMYHPRIYIKSKWVGPTINLDNDKEKIRDIISQLTNHAFSKHFDAIFKSPDHILAFINTKPTGETLGPTMEVFDKLALRMKLATGIINSAQMLKSLAADKKSRDLLLESLELKNYGGLFPLIMNNPSILQGLIDSDDKVKQVISKNLNTNLFLKADTDIILKSPTFLKGIAAADKGAKDAFFKAIPGLKSAIKKQAYHNAILGLFAIKQFGTGAEKQLNRDIIKKIAKNAAEATVEQENDGHKKLKK